MRLKRNRLREFKHFQVVQKKDAEGGTYTEYAPPSCFRAEMWTAGGKVQAEMTTEIYTLSLHDALPILFSGGNVDSRWKSTGRNVWQQASTYPKLED